jgi:hypothetical protein
LVSDGVLSASSSATITVGADKTPPTTPVVTDEGVFTLNTTSLYATWTSSDPGTGIMEYEYCITQDLPTTGTVVKDWTSTGKDASVISENLSLLKGKTYYFGVRARDNMRLRSEVGYSDGIRVEIAPNAPSGLSASAKSATEVLLNWADNSYNETGFKLEQKTGAEGTYAQIATVGANITAFSNTGLTPGTTYYYRIRATNGAGDSGYSNEVMVATPQVPPAAPSNLAATAASGTQINLAWTDNSFNEVGFRL